MSLVLIVAEEERIVTVMAVAEKNNGGENHA